MNSNDIKHFIVNNNGGDIKNWKRVYKKKLYDGTYVRTFENNRSNEIIQVLDKNKELSFISNNETNSFIICLPTDVSLNKVNENINYYKIEEDKKGKDFYIEPEDLPYVMFNNGNPYDIEEISDSHKLDIISKKYGIKLSDIFDEIQENTLVLKSHLTLKEIREYFQNIGLLFIDYVESDF